MGVVLTCITPRERPSNADPPVQPNLGHTKSLTKPFKFKQVRQALAKLPSGKATGPDGIPNEALRMGSQLLTYELTKAFNLILLRGEPIPAWAEGLMYLIYKGKGDKSDLNNYRGITVNNALSKVFSNLLNERLTHLVESRRVLGQMEEDREDKV